VASGLISLAVFFKIRERDPRPVSAEINMIGSIFFLAANVFVSIVYSSIMSFQLERACLLRELASKCYGLPAYFTSKNLFEFPVMLIFPMITLLITYWGPPYGEWKADEYVFIKFYLVLFLVSQCAIGYGYMVSAACKNQVDSSHLSNVVNLPCLFFGGIFANSSTMVKGVGWIQYLSPIKLGFEALTKAEYENSIWDPLLERYDLNLSYGWCIFGLII
jgi:ABC-type multidrug transport system permease subunit